MKETSGETNCRFERHTVCFKVHVNTLLLCFANIIRVFNKPELRVLQSEDDKVVQDV